MLKQNREVIILLHETALQSWLRDASSYCLIVAVIGTGWAMGSSAMQWLGFVLLCLMGLHVSSRHRIKMTPQEAMHHLRVRFGADPDA